MIWLFATLACMAVQSFFSMQEMAVISVNRLEVLFYSSKGDSRALKIAYLLKKPHVLFTTTLIMVNVALQLGSECSRRFYSEMHLSSNLAPLSQILAVVIIAELAPLFAARTWSRPIAMGGVPLLYLFAKILYPLASLLGGGLKLLSRKKSNPLKGHLALKREEMWRMLEGSHSCVEPSLAQEVSDKLLSLRSVKLYSTTGSKQSAPTIHGGSEVNEALTLLRNRPSKEILVYERDPKTVTGVLSARMLVGCDPKKRIRDLARAPFYIGVDQSLSEWLIPFRESQAGVAVVLDKKGKAKGSITFDDIARFLFSSSYKKEQRSSVQTAVVIDRVFSAKTTLREIQKEYGLDLPAASQQEEEALAVDERQSLGRWVWDKTQRPLRTGDCFTTGGIQIEIIEMGIVFPKKIRIITL